MRILKKMLRDTILVFGYFGFSWLCITTFEEGRKGLSIFSGVLAATFLAGLIYRLLPDDDGPDIIN